MPSGSGDPDEKSSKEYVSMRTEEAKEDVRTLESRKARFALPAIRHFRLVIGPDSDLFGDWEQFNNREKRIFSAAVLRAIFDLGYRDLVKFLDDNSGVAREAGFDSEDVPTHSVLSRAIAKFDDERIATAAEWAKNAGEHHVMLRDDCYR